MINNDFWREAASSWSWKAKPDFQIKPESGGKISEELLKKPWEMYEDNEYIDFDKVDCESTVKSMMSGGDVVLEETAEENETESNGIVLDTEKFDEYFERETMDGFVHCFKMLQDCGLPEEVTSELKAIVKRMDVLGDAMKKFKKVYEADFSVFMENYIPEALNLTVGYIEYLNAKVDEKIITSTQTEVVEALSTLLIGVNDKIDEIYKFAAIELKAAAKALNANMNLDGHVDPKFKIH